MPDLGRFQRQLGVSSNLQKGGVMFPACTLCVSEPEDRFQQWTSLQNYLQRSRVESRGSPEDVIQTEGVTEMAGSLGLRDLGLAGLPHSLLCSAGVEGED